MSDHERLEAYPKGKKPLITTRESGYDDIQGVSFFPNRWVSIEGLALLAPGERRGLTIEDEIDACPRLARSDACAPCVARGYPQRGLD
jgi:hypothetical protein